MVNNYFLDIIFTGQYTKFLNLIIICLVFVCYFSVPFRIYSIHILDSTHQYATFSNRDETFAEVFLCEQSPIGSGVLLCYDFNIRYNSLTVDLMEMQIRCMKQKNSKNGFQYNVIGVLELFPRLVHVNS